MAVHPRWLSLELRAALLVVMRLQRFPSASWPTSAEWRSTVEALLFLGHVEPEGAGWRLTEAGWHWVIATGLERGAGIADADWTDGEAAVWSVLGDVLEFVERCDEEGRGEWSTPAAGGADRWRRGVCASRARSARRERRRGPESGRGRA